MIVYIYRLKCFKFHGSELVVVSVGTKALGLTCQLVDTHQVGLVTDSNPVHIL